MIAAQALVRVFMAMAKQVGDLAPIPVHRLRDERRGCARRLQQKLVRAECDGNTSDLGRAEREGGAHRCILLRQGGRELASPPSSSGIGVIGVIGLIGG
jgi:hypothetical protein